MEVLLNISPKNIQGKQANNLDNVLNGNSNTSQLSNKEDILKDIEKSLKTIYDYRVKMASTNDTDALNDLQFQVKIRNNNNTSNWLIITKQIILHTQMT